MSPIYIIEKDYDKALDLCMEARDIIQEMSPNTFIAIIQCHGITGNIYLAQENFNTAEEFYIAAFEMSKKTLFIDDCHQIICIKALANLYHKQNLKQKAIDFCLEQLNFYEQHLTENHINIAHLLMIIAGLYEDNENEKIEFLERASKILQENIHLQYDTTANCFKLIGQYYQKQNVKNKALMFYMKTLEIQKKIYPEDHFILNETQCLIDDIEN
jgi:tetratricopeptide (TPR) repeat protein